MKVYVDPWVDEVIKSFYLKSMMLHPTLDEGTVVNKVNRLYDSIERDLCTFPYKYALAEYREAWRIAGYRDYKIEGFHFAYQIYEEECNNAYVVVMDACYDKDYHD